ncbi:hypothetical protein KI688_009038 [Linnemannia hyalina]|uniref:Extracellular membrane protein CFEM domain-containing protein n=1 Tax=Linnemannia hyalina TaxID=64524 RepID=A0A9P8BW07_9FUNG|nr:hypothetical protein KI688_009038 [Linnemannia hyalina]
MKVTIILAAVIAASSVSAYQCPDTASINSSCRQITVTPLVCSNPNVNKDVCNAKQCNQAYIDNYSACQCLRSPNMFYEHSVNVEGLLKRCGLSTLSNPFGSSSQYKPGQGTQIFSPGGNVRATSTSGNGSSRSAAPIESPTETPVPVQSQGHELSGGAIAGIVIGCLAALALAGLLAWCWRRKRSDHTTTYNTHSNLENQNRGPTRTVISEKVEPVVVKSGTHQTYNNNNNDPANNSTSYTTNTQPVPANRGHDSNTPTTYNTGSSAVHPSTSYNTTTTTGYNTANN